MTTERERAANKQNAQKSTGPRTAEGKARASLNALSHGLSARSVYDSATREKIDCLASLFAGSHNGRIDVMSLARAAAEAQILVERVAEARHQAWYEAASSEAMTERGKFHEFSSRKGLREFSSNTGVPGGSLKSLMPHLFAAPFRLDTEEDAEIINLASTKLSKLVRYERRAVNQRDRALRAMQALILDHPNSP